MKKSEKIKALITRRKFLNRNAALIGGAFVAGPAVFRSKAHPGDYAGAIAALRQNAAAATSGLKSA